MSSRLRRIGDLVVGLVALALVAAPGAGAALPSGYAADSVDNPAPANAGDRFGENIVNAGDVTGDGIDDLLVGVPDASEPANLPGITGKIVYVNGATGQPVGGPIRPPTGDTLISHADAPTAFGAQVATIGDLNGDGVPEHVVSAPGSDLSASAVDMGIVYVYDGGTANVLKRIELAADDRPASPPGFGKAITSTIGEPACQGFGGTAPCPDAQSTPVARGDLDGGGKSDIVIGSPDYAESGTNETNPNACPLTGPATCPGLGRVYVFRGEDITGPAGTRLTTPIFTIQYPDSTTAAQQPHLGAVLSPIGDVGTCAFDETQVVPPAWSCPTTQQTTPSNVPDGYPDYLVSAPGLSAGGVTRAGQTFVVDGRHGLLTTALVPPDPQQDSGFGPPANHQTAPGNLGAAAALPDIYLSATGQESNQGRGYALNGDVTAPDLLARLDDPLAAAGNGFGAFASLGDVAGNDQLNELALGRLKGGPVEIVSSCGMTPLQSIPDAQSGGAGFGAAIAPMGDLNGDGYLDLAIGAPAHNGGVGRVYLMKSNGSPGPDLSCKPPDVGGGGGSGGPAGPPGGPPGGGTPRGKPNRKKVKIGKIVTLTGMVRATERKGSCQRRQKVAILRRDVNSGSWLTVEVAVTKKNGVFDLRVRLSLAQTWSYRARVKQNNRCGGAISKRVDIKATG